MKVSRATVRRNRASTVDAASRLFRERGVDGVTVADIMKAAGLTHGGFYRHFESKSELVSEAVTHAFGAILRRLDADSSIPRAEAMRRYVDYYLSDQHLRAVADGCPLPALGAEAPRSSQDASLAFSAGVSAMADLLAPASTSSDAERGRVLANLATMVGGILLSRAVGPETGLSNEILAAARQSLARTLDNQSDSIDDGGTQ